MFPTDFEFTSEMWIYPGKAKWHFVTVPKEVSEEIRFFHKGSRGFGAVKVRVTTGETHWNTSLFPDKKSGQYFLPVKAAVRQKEVMEAGGNYHFQLKLPEPDLL